MSEVFNNDFTSESNQQPSNSYPYSFEQPAAAQPQPSAPAPEQKKKGGKDKFAKRGKGGIGGNKYLKDSKNKHGKRKKKQRNK